jgi:hypothetical protein
MGVKINNFFIIFTVFDVLWSNKPLNKHAKTLKKKLKINAIYILLIILSEA